MRQLINNSFLLALNLALAGQPLVAEELLAPRGISLDAVQCLQFDEFGAAQQGRLEISDTFILKEGGETASQTPLQFNLSRMEAAARGEDRIEDTTNSCFVLNIMKGEATHGILNQRSFCYEPQRKTIEDAHAPKSDLKLLEKVAGALTQKYYFCFSITPPPPPQQDTSSASSTLPIGNKCVKPLYQLTQWLIKSDKSLISLADLNGQEKQIVDICAHDQDNKPSNLIVPISQPDAKNLIPKVLITPSDKDLKERYKLQVN
jgi:hypothetical protein